MRRTILVLCTLGIASCVLSSCEFRSVRRVGEHRVEIIDAHTSSCRSNFANMADGTQIFTYESDKTKVRLEGEVLTVNGVKYVVPNKDDSIRIKNGRVEINGQPAMPEDQVQGTRGQGGNRDAPQFPQNGEGGQWGC
jgi:hypothetical protein